MPTRALASFVVAILIATACHQKPPTVAPGCRRLMITSRSPGALGKRMAAHCERMPWVNVSMSWTAASATRCKGYWTRLSATSAATGFALS